MTISIYNNHCIFWDKQMSSTKVSSSINALPEAKLKFNLGLVSLPVSKAGVPPLKNIIAILHEISDNLYIVTEPYEGRPGINSRDVLIPIKNYKKNSSNLIIRILNYFLLQLQIAIKVAKTSKDVEAWIFFGGGGLVIPLITAKLLKKKTILSVTVSIDQSNAQKVGIEKIFLKLIVFSVKVNFFIADKIFLSDKNLFHQWALPSDTGKTCIAYEHFIDYQIFYPSIPYHQRSDLVGFVGRLSPEKGIKSFAQSINLLKNSGIQFSIAGDGELNRWLKEFTNEHDISNIVHFEGWIPHEYLKDHLNKLKLLIIPSYTESGPLIALEAIACGTPVLSTNVGIIPGIIFHDKTGFLLENNSPECIANGIAHALEYDDIDRVNLNSLNAIQQKYTFKKVVENYRENLIRVIYD